MTDSMYFNRLYQPFAITTRFTNPLKVLTINPAGYGQMLNASLYTYYRVFASRCTVTMVVGSANDALTLCVVPSIQNLSALNPATTAASSVESMQLQPLAKSKTIASPIGGSKGAVSVSNKVLLSELVGVDPAFIRNDVSGAFNGTYNNAVAQSKLYYWNIGWQTLDGVATANQVTIRIQCEYDVELSNNANVTLSQA